MAKPDLTIADKVKAVLNNLVSIPPVNPDAVKVDTKYLKIDSAHGLFAEQKIPEADRVGSGTLNKNPKVLDVEVTIGKNNPLLSSLILLLVIGIFILVLYFDPSLQKFFINLVA